MRRCAMPTGLSTMWGVVTKVRNWPIATIGGARVAMQFASLIRSSEYVSSVIFGQKKLCVEHSSDFLKKTRSA